MAAKDRQITKKKKHTRNTKSSSSRLRWLITVFLLSLIVSAVFSILSQGLLNSATLLGALLVLLAIIAIGVVFDLVGVAVTAASEAPFHSMASRKVPGAPEAIRLVRNASRVSSICNDIIGDICGVISGAAAALIAAGAVRSFPSVSLALIQLLLSALVASLTITGKAYCKYIALENSTAIVHAAAKVIYFFKKPFRR